MQIQSIVNRYRSLFKTTSLTSINGKSLVKFRGQSLQVLLFSPVLPHAQMYTLKIVASYKNTFSKILFHTYDILFQNVNNYTKDIVILAVSIVHSIKVKTIYTYTPRVYHHRTYELYTLCILLLYASLNNAFDFMLRV